MEHVFTYSVYIYISSIWIYINTYTCISNYCNSLFSKRNQLSTPMAFPWIFKKKKHSIPTPLFSVPSDQWHVTSILFPSGWSFPGHHRYHPSKLSRASPWGRFFCVSFVSGTIFFGTLRIIGPSKLAILRTLTLLYRFKPFHWRVQDP